MLWLSNSIKHQCSPSLGTCQCHIQQLPLVSFLKLFFNIALGGNHGDTVELKALCPVDKVV